MNIQDDLDTKTNAEINKIFAVECAGIDITNLAWHEETGDFIDSEGYFECLGYTNYFSKQIKPFLEAFSYVKIEYRNRYADNEKWMINIRRDDFQKNFYADAATLERAACIALIREKRSKND